MNINKVFIAGNITRDAELKTTPAGSEVASFSVATNKKWKDQSGQQKEKAEFHNIIAWNKLAEIAGRFCKKGLRVIVQGELTTRDWEGPDGKKNYRTEIIASNIEMIDFPAKDETQPEQEIQESQIPF